MTLHELINDLAENAVRIWDYRVLNYEVLVYGSVEQQLFWSKVVDIEIDFKNDKCVLILEDT